MTNPNQNEVVIRTTGAADRHGRTPFTASWLTSTGEVRHQDCLHNLDNYIDRVTRNSGLTHRLI